MIVHRGMARAGVVHMRDGHLPDEAATARLAEELAVHITPGDLVLLDGDLGVGKTTLARALIRAIAGDGALEVPSPTFTLVQSYDLPRFPVHHCDLYRIASPDELDELGLDEALADGVVLVEWPERAAGLLRGDRLEITLSQDPRRPDERRAVMRGHGLWAGRLERMDRLGHFLDQAGFGQWRRSHLQGDASTRRYERLRDKGRTVILMDAPPAPDPGTGDVPYSRVAHLAETVAPFVAIGRALRAHGFAAPRVMATELDGGFLVLEDLGTAGVVDGSNRVVTERYQTAIDLLARLHQLDMPDEPEIAPGGARYRLPDYDAAAFAAEVELLLDWFAPHALGQRLTPAAEAAFREIWRMLIGTVTGGLKRRVWVLRDYHSPNLLWRSDAEGVARIGLLDFQDALRGPAAYDVASLTMDARVDMPEDLTGALVARYVTARERGTVDFDASAFAAEFATMAAQRNTKILGIFARLARRDGKGRYLAHIPRISAYLDRALAHPALAELKAWYDTHLPPRTRLTRGLGRA